MFYESLAENIKVAQKELWKDDRGLHLRNFTREVTFTPRQLILECYDNDKKPVTINEQITPSELLQIIACIYTATFHKKFFKYTINSNITVKYEQKGFFLNFKIQESENRSREMSINLFYNKLKPTSVSEEPKQLVHVLNLRLIYELEQLLKKYTLVIDGITGQMTFGDRDIKITHENAEYKLSYLLIEPYVFPVFLAPDSLMDHYRIRNVTFAKSPKGCYVVHEKTNTVIFTGDIIHRYGILSAFYIKRLFNKPVLA